jgi:hypothetical protein
MIGRERYKRVGLNPQKVFSSKLRRNTKMPKVQKIDRTAESSTVRRGRRAKVKKLTKREQAAAAFIRRVVRQSSALTKSPAVRRQATIRGYEDPVTAVLGGVNPNMWHPLYQHHSDHVLCRLPVTWAIPTQQPAGAAPDDRWRGSNSVYVTGVRIRFTVRCLASVRVRLVVFQPHTSYSFRTAPVAGEQTARNSLTIGMDQGYFLDFANMASGGLVPLGPFQYYNIANTQTSARVPASAPKWVLSASDGSPFTADHAKNEHKPIGDYRWASKHSGSAVTQSTLTSTTSSAIQQIDWNEIDWYCPIKKVTKFVRETDKEVVDRPLEAALFLDAPAAIEGTATTTTSIQIGTFSYPMITVYYSDV